MDNLPRSISHLSVEVRPDGNLALQIRQVATPSLAAGELLLRVEAAPLHPTDLGQLLLAGDLSQARQDGDTLLLPIREAARAALSARLSKPAQVGTEGAGTVVAVGDSSGAQLLGARVASFAGGMYADYRVLATKNVTQLPTGISTRAGAAIWVNPMTALAMVETMRQRAAEAIVHTAAASSLGQMLRRICTRDAIPLVNIVRSAAQAALLHAAGARYILNSQDADFQTRLAQVLAETNATMAFDAIGGGTLAGTILTAMEAAQQRRHGNIGVYGSAVDKFAYIYGRLDLSPTILPPTAGMAWSLGGFLLPHFLAKASAEVQKRMMHRVLNELSSSFATHYTEELPLTSLLDPALLARANAKATGQKFLVCPAG